VPTPILVLAAAAAFGAWLAADTLAWLRGFAKAPSIAGFVRGVVQWGLFCWFADWSWRAASPPFLDSDKLGLDARIYLAGAKAWLSGDNPWSAQVLFHDAGTYGFHFAAPPPSVLLGVPFAWIDDDRLFGNLAVLASFAAALYILRAVRLPRWWIVFPPLLIGILSGNPVVIGLAAIVSTRRWAAPIGFACKVYLAAGLVAARRWRDLAVVVAVVAGLIVVLAPLWLQYAQDYSAISARIAHETDGGFSASRTPTLFLVTAACVAALAAVDWRAACWLAVPALSPFAEFHSSVFALPVMVPGLGALLAMSGTPGDGWAPLAICTYSLWRVARAIGERNGLRVPAWLDLRAQHETQPRTRPLGALDVLREVRRAGTREREARPS
jgi:hypothetical protein